MRSGRRCSSLPHCIALHSIATLAWLRWMMRRGHSMPANWWDQLAWVLPLICPDQHCISSVHSPLHVLIKRDFFTFLQTYRMVGTHGARLDLGEVLHNYVNSLIESHSQMRKMKQETNRAALWEAGFSKKDKQGRLLPCGASKPLVEVSWVREQRLFWRVAMPHLSHLGLKRLFIQPLQKRKKAQNQSIDVTLSLKERGQSKRNVTAFKMQN